MKRKERKETKRPRNDGRTAARVLDLLTVAAGLVLLAAPWAVCTVYGSGGNILLCWGMAWKRLETAIPTLTALLQGVCLLAALRAGRAACRSRANVERECGKLNWCAVWMLMAGGLFMVGTGWDTAFTRNPWALLGLARTAAAALAAALVRKYRRELEAAEKAAALLDKDAEIE